MRTLILLLLLVSLMFPVLTHAQLSPEPTDTPPQRSSYVLPYPGLLPDNALYPLKTLRDNIIGFLISDPIKKADFDLLQSDKRLLGGIYLYQKDPKQLPLAITTISKSENYYEEALSKISQAKQQGFVIGEVAYKLVDSGKKHMEVLTDVFGDGGNNSALKAQIERMKTLEKQAEKYTLKP